MKKPLAFCFQDGSSTYKAQQKIRSVQGEQLNYVNFRKPLNTTMGREIVMRITATLFQFQLMAFGPYGRADVINFPR